VKTLVRIFGYLKPYWRRVILVYVTLFTALALQLAIPQVLARAIDHGILGKNLTYLAVSALIIVVFALGQGLFTFIRSYHVNVLAEKVGYDLRNQLYDRFQELSFSFYDRAQTGQLMSRATDDINQIRGMLMVCLRSLVQGIGTLVAVTVIMLTTDVPLALIALATMPILIWWTIRFGIVIRPMFLSVQQQFGVMTSALQENVAGGRVVRAFAQERAESHRFEAELEELFERNMRAAKNWSYNYPLTLLMSGLSLTAVVWFGAHQVIAGAISIGTLVAFQQYTSLLNEPIRWLGFAINRIARAQASGDRIFEILDTRPVIQNRPGAIPIDDMRGRVTFDHVTFRYRGAKVDALDAVTFTAEPGQTIALVGPTGGGKSSIISLIPRFYDVAEGEVAIDGHDVRDLQLASLRDHIGIVLQETFLFGVTIGQNIAYGRPDATREEIVAAAKAARAHDFIMRMPDGYDTMVGERGVSLSGGQKQRVAIARALAENPKILILDDATSSVDAETEYLIQQALRELMHQRTSFVIAQRLTTVKNADLILVLEDGKITQRGTHEELLAEPGFYADLYDLQLKDQEEAQREKLAEQALTSGGAAASNGGTAADGELEPATAGSESDEITSGKR
jgi:ATP-binding cassette subfamily B protein